jgi:hypothetical protein
VFTVLQKLALRLVSFSSKKSAMSNGKPQNAGEEARKARLAVALRDNLRRRKQQARERKMGDHPTMAPSPQSGHGSVIDPLGNPRNES